MSKKQGNPIDIAKGKALTRRWKELKAQGKKEITEDRLAQILGGARSAIPFWKRGESWPSLSKEQDIERFLLVPLGFFARIGEGMDYREAISPPPVIPAPFADWDLVFFRKEQNDSAVFRCRVHGVQSAWIVPILAGSFKWVHSFFPWLTVISSR